MAKIVPIYPSAVIAFDATQFRNVSEILKELRRVKEEISDDAALVTRYQAMLSGMRVIAARSPFSISDDDLPAPSGRPSANKTAVRKLLQGEKAVSPQADIINRYADKLDFLNGLEDQLQREFQQDRAHNKAVTEIRALKKLVTQKLGQAHTVLSRFAKKQAPREFLALTKGVSDTLRDRIAGNFDTLTTKTLVTFSPQSVTFFNYLQLKGFTNDDGFIFGNFYVILACTIDAGARTSYYVSTSPNFISPDKVKLKHQFSTLENGLEIIDDLFELEKFTGLIADSPSPFESTELDPSKFSVRDALDKVVVGDTGVLFLLKKTANKIAEDVLKTLLAELRTLTKKRLKRMRYRIETPRAGRVAIRIVFPPDPTPGIAQEQLNRAQLRVLRDQLGLTDTQVKKILQALT